VGDSIARTGQLVTSTKHKPRNLEGVIQRALTVADWQYRECQLPHDRGTGTVTTKMGDAVGRSYLMTMEGSTSSLLENV